MQHHLKYAARLATATAAVLSVFNAQAADETVGPEVIVTATRFSEPVLKAPANVSIITAEDIRNSPATNLPDVLKTTAGIDVRSLTGNMGIDTTVDMRGFGDTASSNTLILLDGQRLSPVDAGAISWSAIPLNSIQRIEIIRGAGTVLYGDQASGGVINIITDKSGKPKASMTATLGSYGYRGADAQGAGSTEQGYFNIAAHYADADGWRDNSNMDQQAISGRAGLYLPAGETFLDYAVYKDASGTPGALFNDAYRSDPTSARHPLDSQKRDGYRLRPGVSYTLSDKLKADAELSAAHEDYHANVVSFALTNDRTRDTFSFTPRLQWKHDLGSFNSETVVGMDYYDGQVKAKFNGTSFITTEKQGAEQKSTALYAQNSTELGDGWILSAGARSQRMDQSANQGAYTADFGFGPFLSPAISGDTVRTRNAYDLGLIYKSSGWRIYGKAGTTFRFANTDELFGFDPLTGNPVFAGDLKPQHGVLHEIGASFEQGTVRGKATLYRLNLSDEIGFDTGSFANVNFAPTRRNGLETELDWRLAEHTTAHFSYTYIDATFRDGVYAGKELPLVPRDKASAQLTWQCGAVGTYSAVANYVGNRRYSGDFANANGELAGYTTLDLQGSWDIKPWTLSAKLLNALDKRYAPFGGVSSGKLFFYPADARSLFVSARYQFK